MNKLLLFVISLNFLFVKSNAQSFKSISPEIYDELKTKGELNPFTNYVFEQQLKNESTHKLIPKIHQTDSVGTLPCNCLVQLDSTFSVAEFLGYSASNDYRNDDASTAAKLLPFSFNFYGTNYDSVFINNNGNVSFLSGYSTFTSTGFPSTQFNMIAPFWADVDTRPVGSGLVYYKITDHYMIVKWENVGYFSNQIDKLNTFQLIISDGTDSLIPDNNNVAFCYGDMQWTTGAASQGVNGFGGIAATVGVNNSNGINYAQICRPDSIGNVYDGPYGLTDGVDFLDNQSYFFDVSSPSNIPATSYDSICDTIVVVSNFVSFDVFINAMEISDQAFMNIVSSAPGMNFTIDTLPSCLRIHINYTPTQLGIHNLKIAFWDSYNPSNISYYQKSFDVINVSSVGLESITEKKDYVIYPNPAGNQLNIEIPFNRTINKIQIKSMNGKVLLTHSGKNNIDISQLNLGMYIVEITDSNGKIYYKKLIKE